MIVRRPCTVCGRPGGAIAGAVGVCGSCLEEGSATATEAAARAHRLGRREFGLPAEPPKSEGGAGCSICANECRMGEGERGYCGLRYCEGGRLVARRGSPAEGVLEWYRDPLPTNCVAGWTCAATGRGYPNFSHRRGPERGYRNLAVFYEACSFDCLFCQNWHFRRGPMSRGEVSAEDLARAVTADTACICFFGGDPTPQLAHALRASEIARSRRGGGILRICWETNGSMNRRLLERMIALSMESGGCIKFDLKAWGENLHVALTGVSNRRTLENFAFAVSQTRGRADPPPLVASTLLVPGYVEKGEVSKIARFIASLEPAIPYSLLAFHSDCAMRDLPPTGRQQAGECLSAARAAGLVAVRLGNVHLIE